MNRSNIWFTRFWAVAGAVSIRTKILGIVLALVLVLGIGITLQVRAMLTQLMNVQLEEQSISVTRDLAARATDAILINNLYAMHQLLKETLTNNISISYAFIADAQGNVLAHTFGDGFPAHLLQANTALGSVSLSACTSGPPVTSVRTSSRSTSIVRTTDGGLTGRRFPSTG